MLPRALHRPREEKGVKAHMHRIVEHLSERLLPELGSHLGIEVRCFMWARRSGAFTVVMQLQRRFVPRSAHLHARSSLT